MYTLYSRPGTGGFVAEAALEIAGAAWRKVDVPAGAPDPAFLRLSPLGQVPALTLPDGRTITESAAICLCLADRHPGAGLAPQPADAERPEFLRWLVFMAAALYPAMLRWFYAPRHTADPACAEPVRQAAQAEIDRCFAVIEAALADREWIAGTRFSIADVYLLMLACWTPPEERPRPEWERIGALCRRVGAHPVVAALNESHRLF